MTRADFWLDKLRAGEVRDNLTAYDLLTESDLGAEDRLAIFAIYWSAILGRPLLTREEAGDLPAFLETLDAIVEKLVQQTGNGIVALKVGI